MKLKSYAQHGEDDLIWKFFDRKSKGLIIEVGAFDGIHLSNSYALENLGWDSICIEPNPTVFDLLKKNRPGAVCFDYAVTGDDSIKKVNLQVEELGLLSGTDVDVEDIKKRYEKRNLKFKGIQTKEVPAITLNALFEDNSISPNEIDCLTLDTEGNELEILKGLDLRKYRPKLVIVEANTAESRKKLTSHFVKQKYFFAGITGVNLIFVGAKKDVEKIHRAVIDCIPQKQMHPLGEKYTIQAVIDGQIRKAELSLWRKFFDLLKK